MEKEAFRNWRTAREFSQATAGEMFGVTRNTIIRWESGASPIPETVDSKISELRAGEPHQLRIIDPKARAADIVSLVAKTKRAPEIAAMAFDPVALKCTALPTNPRPLSLAIKSNPQNWQVIPECRVVCSALIPNPTPWSAPGFEQGDYWAVMSMDGSAWHQTAGYKLYEPWRAGSSPERAFREKAIGPMSVDHVPRPKAPTKGAQKR